MSRPIDCETLSRICDALTGLQDGAVMIEVQDGAVVLVSRTEKLRAARPEPRWTEAR